MPGVFVAGDVRADSVKRVASAVGEGAMAVTLVHRYLESVSERETRTRGHHGRPTGTAPAAGEMTPSSLTRPTLRACSCSRS